MKKSAILAIGLMLCIPHVSAYAVNDVSPADTVSSSAPASNSSIAKYGDRTVDLRKGWGGAQACAVQDTGTTCFDTEKEMLEFIAASEPHMWSGAGTSAGFATCSSGLLLYANISYGTPVVGIYTRFTVTSLAGIGFDNVTTSYKVGACSSNMWNGAGATGSLYPGNTSAFAQFPNMVTGWNNTISSVYVG